MRGGRGTSPRTPVAKSPGRVLSGRGTQPPWSMAAHSAGLCIRSNFFRAPSPGPGWWVPGIRGYSANPGLNYTNPGLISPKPKQSGREASRRKKKRPCPGENRNWQKGPQMSNDTWRIKEEARALAGVRGFGHEQHQAQGCRLCSDTCACSQAHLSRAHEGQTMLAVNPLLGSARTLKELISKILQNLKQVPTPLSQRL